MGSGVIVEADARLYLGMRSASLMVGFSMSSGWRSATAQGLSSVNASRALDRIFGGLSRMETHGPFDADGTFGNDLSDSQVIGCLVEP